MTQDEFDKLADDHLVWLNSHGTRGNILNIMGKDLSGLDMFKRNLTGSTMVGCKFHNTNMERVNLDNAFIMDGDFVFTNMAYATLYEADLQQSSMTAVNLSHAYLKKTDLTGCKYSKTQVNDKYGRPSTPMHPTVEISGANLEEADLRGIDLCKITVTGSKGFLYAGAKIDQSQASYLRMVGFDVTSMSITGETSLTVNPTGELSFNKTEETRCNHNKKYINSVSASLKFWYCPDCKTDLGDA